MKAARSFTSVLLGREKPLGRSTTISVPTESEVRVKYDSYAIPHIFAKTDHDLMVVLGYHHAHDRLWQMEMTRRLCTGSLSEVAGKDTLPIDTWVRIAGLPELRKRVVLGISDNARNLLTAYTKGINSYIESQADHLPVEFRSVGLKPDPWTLLDTLSPIPINAWYLQTNYKQELLAALNRGKLTGELWNEMFPSHPGANLQKEPFFENAKNLKIGKLISSAAAFYPDFLDISGGSNSWITKKSDSGYPLLANDPHLGISLPQIWYFCHLQSDTQNICGATMPGNPLIVIGRNDHLAWGFTNVMLDCTDLVYLRVDPENPTTYFVGNQTHKMETRTETVGLPDGSKHEVVVYSTIQGIVITEVNDGIDAVICLKWYGTFPEEPFPDTTVDGFLHLNAAQSVREGIAAGREICTVGQNLLFGDAAGDIGWVASGRIPIRRGYTGRLPSDGSSGNESWTEFVNPSQNPSDFNPPEGIFANANNRNVDDDYPHQISDAWCSPYRFDQIMERLSGLPAHTKAEYQNIQMDVHSKRAEMAVPALLSLHFQTPDAQIAAEQLKNWDLKMDRNSTAALFFNVFLVKFVDILCGDLLDEGLSIMQQLVTYQYTCVDTIFEHFGDGSGGSPVLAGKNLPDLCEQALAEATGYIRVTLGKRAKRWKWGRLHTYLFAHPGSAGGIQSWLLNRGRYPADGDSTTISMTNYRSSYRGDPLTTFEVLALSSMRFVCSLHDRDANYIVGPLGQSGRPESAHYADMVKPYREGKLINLPLTESKVDALAVSSTLFKCDPV